ncbi:MAG: LacI family transcriptional regulator [Clostridiales bacterium]|nr:LacI family transcriptional regulator [Clostridiales bacterium]
MARQPGNPRRRQEIPVVWDCDCRGTPICVTTVEGIQRMAAKKGYALKVYESAAEYQRDAAASRTVIVVGFESARLPNVLGMLQADRRRVVVTSMDADHIDAHYSCATFSRRISTEQMLDYLLARGCRRFALVGCGDRSVNDIVHSDAMEKHLRPFEGAATGCSFWYHARIAESFEAFFARRNEFDAALCPNDFAAVALLHFCEQHGLRVPEHLLLATFKGNRISQYCKPSITTLTVDFNSIGVHSVAVWLFLQDIEEESLQIRITVPGRIVERESTGAPPARPGTGLPLRAPDDSYQGGPFYEEPTLKALMRVERCLQSSDELDMRIISLILSGIGYEKIAEDLFLCESSLQYRVRGIFRAAQVNGRRAFEKLMREHFTQDSHFSDGEAEP